MTCMRARLLGCPQRPAGAVCICIANCGDEASVCRRPCTFVPACHSAGLWIRAQAQAVCCVHAQQYLRWGLQGAQLSITAEADPALTGPRSVAEERLAAQLAGAASASAQPGGAAAGALRFRSTFMCMRHISSCLVMMAAPYAHA